MQLYQPTFGAQFISMESAENIFDAPFSIHQCQFNREFYTDSLFSKMNIFFPDSLESAVIKRKSEFLAGRYCAQKAAQLYGIEELRVGVGINRCPIWPSTIVGSISHSNSRAIAAIGSIVDMSGIGIDIEEQINLETMHNIHKQILSDEEFRYILQSPDELARLFTICFSIKESFFKAIYPLVLRYLDFNVVSVKSIDCIKNQVLLQLNEHLTDNFKAGDYVRGKFSCLLDNHVITVVALNKLSIF